MRKSLEANKHTDPSRTLSLKRMTNVLLMHHSMQNHLKSSRGDKAYKKEVSCPFH